MASRSSGTSRRRITIGVSLLRRLGQARSSEVFSSSARTAQPGRIPVADQQEVEISLYTGLAAVYLIDYTVMRPMPTKALRKLLRDQGCVLVGTEGSHEKWEAPGGHTCTIKAGTKQQAPGTLRNIQEALAPELGQGWIDKEQR